MKMMKKSVLYALFAVSTPPLPLPPPLPAPILYQTSRTNLLNVATCYHNTQDASPGCSSIPRYLQVALL